MDNLTHTLVGVHMAHAGFTQRFGKAALWIFVLASNMCDLDIFWSMHRGELGFLERRMLSHSLFALPFLAGILAGLFKIFTRKTPFLPLFWMALLGLAVHVFFDLVNSYGVVLLYPLSRARLELAWLFIIDIAVWTVLIAPLLLGFWWQRQKLSRISLALLFVYVSIAGLGRWRGSALLAQEAATLPEKASFSYVFPEPFGPQRFRGVIRQGDTYRVYLLSILTGRVEEKASFTTLDRHPDLQDIRRRERARRLEWFAKAPVWREIKGNPNPSRLFELFDLRFFSTVLPFRDIPFAFVFKGDPAPSEKHPPTDN